MEVIAVSSKKSLWIEIVEFLLLMGGAFLFFFGAWMVDRFLKDDKNLALPIILMIGGAIILLTWLIDNLNYYKKLIVRKDGELLIGKNSFPIGAITDVTYEAVKAKPPVKPWGTLTIVCGQTEYRIKDVDRIVGVYCRLQELIAESKKQNPNYEKENTNG